MASFAYAFDAAGHRTGITYADGSRSVYAFDDAYRLTRDQRVVGSGDDEGTVYDEQYAYDPVGNRTGRLAFDSAAYGADAATRGLWHMDAASAEFTPSAHAFDVDESTRLLWHLDESDQAKDSTEYLNHGAFIEPVGPLAAGMHDAAVLLDGTGGITAAHHPSLDLGDAPAGEGEAERSGSPPSPGRGPSPTSIPSVPSSPRWLPANPPTACRPASPAR